MKMVDTFDRDGHAAICKQFFPLFLQFLHVDKQHQLGNEIYWFPLYPVISIILLWLWYL